ncbi:FUN14 domain-containing protein [Haloarchaeobius sp. FL176]|uniref:FUN14 domain-containing protein n=1 Tax=Haloarchaeobius sp. FL176 TaxID=2967129 RepID=UPI002147F8ED|nr:FUN14 domain-containing protein [Haloarchaeobius sp. FL176]
MLSLQLALDPQQLGLEFGTGAVIGGLIGFAAKKVAKIIAVLVGLEMALFKFLESKGYISVKWDELSGGILGAAEQSGEINTSWVEPIISTLSIGAGFTGGFMVGFRKG